MLSNPLAVRRGLHASSPVQWMLASPRIQHLSTQEAGQLPLSPPLLFKRHDPAASHIHILLLFALFFFVLSLSGYSSSFLFSVLELSHAVWDLAKALCDELTGEKTIGVIGGAEQVWA